MTQPNHDDREVVVVYPGGRAFEYDRRKSDANLAKHGIDFIVARRLWLSRNLSLPAKPGNDESRRLVIGRIGGTLWTAVVTERAGRIRIISVRRARREEVRRYEQARDRLDIR